MSQEQNIPQENFKEQQEENTNISRHFPEDSHAPPPPSATETSPHSQQTTNLSAEVFAKAGDKPQSENMEIHKHPHHVTHTKKWPEYLLEFLMLFLAVFLGFLAENARERAVENHREKEYINSMIEDLQTDTMNLLKLDEEFLKIESRLDTVLRSFDEGIHIYSESWTRNFILSHKMGFPDFYYTDRTIQQLKNSGGMRLIKNKRAANGIINYDAGIKDLVYEESFLSARQLNYIDEVLKIWSVDQMLKGAGVTSWANHKDMLFTKNYWITNEPLAFEHLFNRISEYNEAIIRHRKAYGTMKTEATGLIGLLKKEYHLP
jgi:hypothetical protein